MSNTTDVQSGPLSDEDLYILKGFIIQAGVGFAVYGVQATFSLIALYFILSRGIHRSKVHLFLFIITIIMLLSSTGVIIAQIEFNLVQLPINGINPPDPEVILPILENLKITSTFLQRINFLLSDGIVVWRTWILFPQSLVVKIVLSICMIGSTVCTLVNASLDAARTHGNFRHQDDNFKGLIVTIPLLVTNIIATSLVGYKAWAHWGDIKRNLGDTSSTSIDRTQKILLLLVESGSIYCIFWLAFTFLVIIFQDGNNNAFQAYAAAMPSIAALYPVLIVLMAALENSKSKNDHYGPGFSLSQSIRFAETPDTVATTTSDNRYADSESKGYSAIAVSPGETLRMSHTDVEARSSRTGN
ncbi:hypothetical protein K435DRAFT_854683 [Dendrothele bispora CBS 962.96]|uniref:Family A G protein-coupled receptor-like protein n=1 Tax=Dendrothele bispora (strain CBS 962.96) TaxID=1314807 RepID=A0A4S8MD33_DENBC|nr:hypothetical protein K435DRAFT_854683 [Dendrothele bispora CBS 962.96]